MKIKAQDGKIYEVHNVEMRMSVIKCQDLKDKRRKNILGKYTDLQRTCEVMAEIASCKTGYFEMPLR